MNLTFAKLKRRIPEIMTAAVRATLPLDNIMTCIAPGPVAASTMAPPSPPDDPAWRLLRPGERWGGAPGADPAAPVRRIDWNIPADGGSTHWLQATLQISAEWRNQPVLFALDWEGAGQASLEAIAYLNGAALAGLDEFHRSVLLPPTAHTGPHELLVRCYLPFPQSFGGMHLHLRDESIFQLGQLMRTLLEAAETYPANDPFRHVLSEHLNAAYNTLDLRNGWQSENFAASACVALDQLRSCLEQSNGLTPNGPRLLATGHAHLDVAWLWPLWRTRQKVAHTVATALHLMDRYPDYHFSMSQPQVYAYLKEDDPALYARLKQKVAEGRFEPVGMMWLETDCNLTSGESLIRQLLHGARFLADEFGVSSPIAWLPDVFGFSPVLPQLLRGCGIDCFLTTKLSWSQVNRMPADTFRWRGIDGSEVLAHFVSATTKPAGHPADPQEYTYVGQMIPSEVAGLWNNYRQQAINRDLLYIYGWGDGGGGPTEEMLETAQILRNLPGLPQIRLGRADHFFQQLCARLGDDPRLPTWAGELYLEYHRGTYTSQARTKQANRAAELLYREAEWLNAWATILGGPNQQDVLNTGWQRILLNQFHDILPGSSIAQVYVDSNADYAEIQRIGQEVRDAATSHILRHEVEEADPGRAAEHSSFVMWNSLPWSRSDYARLELTPGAEAPLLTNTAGKALSTQLIEERPGERALLIAAAAPSYGYTCAKSRQARPESAQSDAEPIFNAQQSILSNGELRLEFDSNGEIASLYDRRHERELIMPGTTGNQLVAYEDRPLYWDAWDIDHFYAEKAYPVHDIADWRLVETGPLRAAVEIIRRIGRSAIRQRICLWRDSRRVDFVTEVDWQERQTLLRTLFPLHINAARATCEIQFGAVERPTHRNTTWDQARFEVCAHRWVDLSEGDYGVALLNDGKYGHSLHHSTLGISLLKGSIHPDPAADQGQHRFTYSLLPHPGDWRAAQVARRAYELNVPLRVQRSIMRLPPQPSVSFLSTPNDHIIVETIKRAEDGDGLIIRIYEAHNQRGPASLVFDRPIIAATETDLLERATEALPVDGNAVHVNIRPFEVKTLRVWLEGT